MATLHDAAREGDMPALLALLHANPLSLNARDRHSRTPYPALPASWAGQAEVVRFLCEKHADVGAAAADDMAAIHFACQKGHEQVVRYLLAAGASLNSRTRKGMTAIHYAIQGSHSDVAKLLIKKGASLDARNKAGKTPIDLAKDEQFRTMVLAAERERKEAKSSQSHEKKARSSDKKKNEASTTVECTAEINGDQADHQAPPFKKPKLQLAHLATDGESDLGDEENG